VIGLALRTKRRPSVSLDGIVLGAVAVAAALAVVAAVAARHAVAVAAVRERPLLVAAGLAYGALSLVLYLGLTPLVAERDD
jgi:ABC-type amino acid transport system permease subunit